MNLTSRDKLIHDFKSSVSIIKSQAFLLQERAKEDADNSLKEISQDIIAASDRLVDLIDKNL